MPENKLLYLGNRLREIRKENGLTQQQLADRCNLAVKTIQDIEKGKKNTSYETLNALIECLGITADMLFPSKVTVENKVLQHFIGKLQSCSLENQMIILNTVDCLADQLQNRHHKFKDLK